MIGRIKGPEKSYCTLVDIALMKEAEEQSARPMTHPLRPSAAGECSRKLAHELMAYEGKAERISEERKPSVLRLLRLGHFIEEHAIDDLKKIEGFNIRFQQQVVEMFTLPSGKIIEGSTDCVLWSDKHKALLDVKSVGDRFDHSFNSKWDLLLANYARSRNAHQFDDTGFWVEDVTAFIKEIGSDDPLAKNLVQLNLYTCTDFLQKRGIDHGVVYRYQKNASKTMEIRFKPDFALFEATKQKFTAIETAVAEGNPEAVRKDYVLGNIGCAYCPYQKRCWPSAAKRDHFASLPPKQWATKLGQLERSKEVSDLFYQYEATEELVENRKRLEKELLIEMEGHGVEKIKAASGQVYEIKRLQKGLELRKGKE